MAGAAAGDHADLAGDGRAGEPHDARVLVPGHEAGVHAEPAAQHVLHNLVGVVEDAVHVLSLARGPANHWMVLPPSMTRLLPLIMPATPETR